MGEKVEIVQFLRYMLLPWPGVELAGEAIEE